MQVEYILLHHSGTPLTQSGEELDLFYKDKGGSISKIGRFAPYHYSIDYHGNIMQHRGDDEVGLHSKIADVNNKSLSVCLIGNFDEEEPLEAQKLALRKLILQLRESQGDLPICLYKDLDTESTSPGFTITNKWLEDLFQKPITIEEIKIREELEALRRNVKDLSAEREANKVIIQKLNETIREFEDKIIYFKTQAGDNLKKVGEAEGQTEKAKVELEANRQDLERVLKLAGEKETKVQRVVKERDEVRDEFENVLKLVGRKEADSSLLNNKIKSLERELENVLKLAGRREVETNDLRVQLIKKEKRNRNLSVQLVSSKKETKIYKKQIAILEERLRRKSIWQVIFGKKKKEYKVLKPVGASV